MNVPPRRRRVPRPPAWLLAVPLLLVFALCPAAVAADTGTEPGAIRLTTDAAYRFQGWGTSLAWWANVVVGWQSAGQVEDALFGQPTPQHPDRLGLNVIRYDIGASPVLWCAAPTDPAGACAPAPDRTHTLPVADASRVPACRSFRPGAAVPALADAAGQTPELGRDRNQVAVLRAALAREPRSSFALEAFANSPPWWMTVTGCPQGNPEAADARDNLDPQHYADYAAYLSGVLQAFRRAGVTFDTVAPLNEPENPWGQVDNPYTGQPFCTANCQEGMHFGPEPPLRQTPAIAPLLDAVCTRLAADGLRTRVSTPDGFNPSDTAALLGLTGAPPSCVSQVNTHMYDFVFPNGLVPYGQGISIYDPSGASGGRKALASAAQSLGKGLWMSEFGSGGAPGDVASGLVTSSMIAADMRWLRPTAWVHWQAVEGAGGWGLFEAPSFPSEGPLTKTRRFSALEQYARFIRPGAGILTTLDPLDDPIHETSATMAAVDDLRHPRRVVIVGTNTQATARHVVYDLSAIDMGQARAVTRYRTSATEDVRRLGTTSQYASTIQDDQPAGSITTYVIDLAC